MDLWDPDMGEGVRQIGELMSMLTGFIQQYPLQTIIAGLVLIVVVLVKNR